MGDAEERDRLRKKRDRGEQLTPAEQAAFEVLIFGTAVLDKPRPGFEQTEEVPQAPEAGRGPTGPIQPSEPTQPTILPPKPLPSGPVPQLKGMVPQLREPGLSPEQQAQRKQREEAAHNIFALFPKLMASTGWASGTSDLQRDPFSDIVVQRGLFDALEAMIGETPEETSAFLTDLFLRRDSPEASWLLQTYFGMSEEDVADFYLGNFARSNIQDFAAQVWPDKTIEEVSDLAFTEPDDFLREIRKGGQTTAKSALLRAIGLSVDEINSVWDWNPQTVIEIEGTRRKVTVLDNDMVLDERGQEIGRLDPETFQFEPYEYKIGDTWSSFTAGVGDVIVTAGGATKWLGADGIGEKLSEFGGFLQAQGPADTLGEFSWGHLYNPRFWGTKVVRTSAFSLALLPAAIVGSWAGAAVAGAVGAGRFGTYILQALGAGGFSRTMEGALEAGGTYDEALAKGMTEVEARQAANSVFLNNLKLVGVDAAQFALIFAPTPKGVFRGLISKGYVKTTMVGGKIAFTGLTEAGEEYYQERIQRIALGETVQWDAEMKEVMALGGIMGVGLGAGGAAYTSIKNQIVEALPPDVKAQFDEAQAAAIAEGLDAQLALERGLDAVASTKEGQNVIDAVVENAKIDAFENEINPADEVEEIAWEKTFETMRDQAPQLPVTEAIEGEAGIVTPRIKAVVPKKLSGYGLEDSPRGVVITDTFGELGAIDPTTRAGVATDLYKLTDREAIEYRLLKGPTAAQGQEQKAFIEAIVARENLLERPIAPAIPGEAVVPAEAASAEVMTEIKRVERLVASAERQVQRTTPPWSTRTNADYGLPVPADSTIGKAWLRLRKYNEELGKLYEQAGFGKPPKVPPKPPIPTVKAEMRPMMAAEDAVIKAAPSEDIVKASSDALEAQAGAVNLPPPNKPPGATGYSDIGGDNSENALNNFANRIIEGEDAGRAALRVWSGTRRRMATETIAWWKKGNQTLKGMGVGRTEGRNQRMTQDDGKALFQALHGEGVVPRKFKGVYDDIKVLLDQEAADMLAFDPTFSRVLMAHPDYFPRGWRPPKETGRIRPGAKPGFLKLRVDATFTEMLEAGWEPVSWNPYDMLALRRLAGTEYREGRILVDRLKTFDKAIAERDAPRDGWKVPKVGPAFEGKPYVGGDGKAYMTPKIAVPNSVADILESTYGTPVEFRVGGVDVWRAVSAFGAVTKRAKLFASLFQHVDFLTRDVFVAFTPEGIRHGVPLKLPSLAARITVATFNRNVRGDLERRILSGDPLYKDSTISLKMVADAGWEMGADELLIRRDVAAGLEGVVKETPKWNTFRRITRRLASVQEFFETSLFDVMYRESQAFALEHVVIPRLRRLHPGWTDEQIAGSAAEEVNKQYSTLPVWQSILRQPQAREAARAIFFSFNESESWIRQATSTVWGKNRAYWQEYQVGTLLSLIVIANAINKLSEDEWLPIDRYVPITFGSPYSSMPGGVAYNSKFMSPRLPWNGRNGQPLYLDIVGQADTWLRWMFDPAGALTARYNVLPRALMNQIQGKDFWGRELTDMADRARQAVSDLFFPIGIGHLVEVGRQLYPPVGKVIPEAEGRVGIVGGIIQATGLNVRAQQTNDMLDQFAKDSGLKKADGTPVQSWADLEPSQRRELEKNKQLQSEIGLRGTAAVERNYPGAAGFAELDRLDQERVVRGEAMVAEHITVMLDMERAERFEAAQDFRGFVSELKREIADRKSQVDKDFKLFQTTGTLPEDPNKRALVEYYNLFEKAKKPSGVMDWERANKFESDLRNAWTPEQAAYVDRNIGLTEWGPLMQEYISQQKTLSESGYWEEPERDRRVFRLEHPEIEEILTGKFYNYRAIDEGAETISLRWQDVYRQIDDMQERYRKMTDTAANELPPLSGITEEKWALTSADGKRAYMMDFEKEGIYREYPGFFDDDKTRDALNKGFGEALSEQFVKRANLVHDTSPSSQEVKLFMLKHPDLLTRGLALEEWTDDLSGENITSLELQVQWRATTDEYEAIDSNDVAARKAFRLENTDWADAMRKVEAYGWDNEMAIGLVDDHVTYGQKVDQFSGNSAEVLLWRYNEGADYNAMRVERGFADVDGALTPLDNITERPLEVQAAIWKIDVDYRTEDEEYSALPSDTMDERNAYLEVNSDYAVARRQREAYQREIPQVDEYVAYHQFPDYGFQKDRYLLEHTDLYDTLVAKGLKVPFESDYKVPNVKYDEIYEQYKDLFDQYDDVQGTESQRAAARKKLLEDNPMFAKAKLRRQAHGLFFPEDMTGHYVNYYSLPEKGMRQELYLAENPKFASTRREILGLVIPETEPNIASLRISVKWEQQDNQYYAYSDRDSEFYVADLTERSAARKTFLLGNLNYAKAQYSRDAYDLEGYPENLVDGYADYYIVQLQRPEGWDRYWADDRYLAAHQDVYAALKQYKEWDRDIDFTAIPSVSFEKAYNEVYVDIRQPDGKADRWKRKQFRGQNRWFDAEGVKAGLWEPWEPSGMRVSTVGRRFAIR